MNLVQRIGIASGGLLLAGALAAPAALADASCTISGNGAGSTNVCNVTIRGGHSKPCEQSCGDPCGCQTPKNISKVKIGNHVFVISNTGGNKANKNTGGDVSITSGDSNVDISITNTVNP